MMRAGSSSSASRCQECGNQAKRDCEYMRCRTCCKSRGFQCSTHINSTWIPLSLRRPREYYFHHPHTTRHNQPFNLSSSTSPVLAMQTGDFPSEVNTTATFRCVRMMLEDNLVDQCAYETTVDIGGHVFKGLLYDQGPMQDDEKKNDEDQDQDGCFTSIGHVHRSSVIQQQFQHEQEHQHQSSTSNLNMTSSLPPAAINCDMVSSSPYPCPFYPFMPGMLYFPCPKS
ncbi:protein SHI RELATED SEQUENCE 3-like [Impatiens glandulifera]|uniref:protein SHI RELATED SEQUENCE 3-like n=1 Tax=Impatiens glandulifera TaxID=253017 RepID=UPI001FB07B5E|nr:protein SHI RELATED SEQUENCE 3-like [Impatiens glandulifera]